MRERLLHAPAWVLGLVNGSLFGLFWVAWTRYGESGSWTAAVVQGALMGLFFGAVMGRVQHRQQRGVREVAARSPGGLSKRVRRAALRGPAPAEPALREAAHGLVLAQLTQLDRQRRWGPTVFALVAALSVFLAVTDSPWWWLAVGAWTAAAFGHPWLRRRLRRRAALLRAHPGPETEVGASA
ncbi:hypothetical protein SAMN05660748_3902 [Blastococcus aggregatus]|uniref:Uncharacterized protein n=1 Tax=Blastococcus aggregatus TaxID=38502 RepID=A0A285VEF9_9ACTN|nr:hypothetical protein [Blastococcus aggregatus]SOC51948.1 hypothetical protein SAMN05660748_3902 [Blastococcus aggregatus]